MRKNVLHPFVAIAAGDMSGNLTGPAVGILDKDNVSIQLHFTGTPTGTFTVEVSNDYKKGTDVQPEPGAAGNWTALPLSPAPAATGGAGDIMINLTQLASAYIRVRYTATGGAGALTATFVAKSISG